LQRFHLARQQGPRKGHALGLAMGGADAGMEAPQPGAKHLALGWIGPVRMG
jgi:hypothetical protein